MKSIYIISIVIIVLLDILGCSTEYKNQEKLELQRAIDKQKKMDLKSRQESEAIIREIIAEKLNKNPKDLTDNDFAKVKELEISEKELPSTEGRQSDNS